LGEYCGKIGTTLAAPRIYLTGQVSVENGGTLIDERDFPGRQGRLAFVFLAIDRHRPVRRDELISAIWRDEPPNEVDGALGSILSKLRGALQKVGLGTERACIEVRRGCVELRLPSDTWVDVEAAINAIDEAEGAMRARDLPRAWGSSNVVVTIARRTFLSDEEAPWIERLRGRFRATLARGLQCLSTISADQGEFSLAVQYATEMVDLQPFQETAYQHLMRLHARMGNSAEALRIFNRCRELFREELGSSPSNETQALFLSILRGQTP
jgi:SARP family transcriptional regulator, regulator of embCAB operon